MAASDLVQELHSIGDRLLLKLQRLPQAEPVEILAFSVLVVFTAPHSPGWALCIGSATCQDPGDVASVFSLQLLLSLCPRKLEKHTGKNATWGGGEGGKTPEPGEGCRAPPAERRLPGAWSATTEAASAAGRCRAQECHTTVTTAISCRRHALVLAGPPKLPE
ncbi:small integral membrane protein 5 [Dama dama]|uniref:small integral membrane protein 5 isoform X1 n=1 Tax=Dama dama TaxID=30532 RepID=UPI002A35A222|nr:small integral membrane protein 5 isoform X1 [Dama dama]